MIQPPSWAKAAIPKSNGWHDPRTDELLKSIRLSGDQINEYLGISVPAPAPEVLVEVPTMETSAPMIDESPMASDDLDTMTKLELEDLGRDHGIELDRRKSKAALVVESREHMLG